MLIRHAKSGWADSAQPDFDRPLNERGKKDAPAMGERLKTVGLIPDAFISSSAKRARQTAKRLAEGVGYEKELIRMEDKLYLCEPHVFDELISHLDDSLNTVFIVGHNPGITAYANSLSDRFAIDDMPTCSVVATQAETGHWSDFRQTKKEVIFFEYPKIL